MTSASSWCGQIHSIPSSPLHVTSRTASFASSGETVHPSPLHSPLPLCPRPCPPPCQNRCRAILTHTLRAVCHSPRKQAHSPLHSHQRCHTSARGSGAKFPYPSWTKRRLSRLLLAPRCSLRLPTTASQLVSQSVCARHPFSSHY